jgi:membrane-associated protease RseP (regulator of RpoE activity)
MFHARSLIAAAALFTALSSAHAQTPAKPSGSSAGAMQDMMQGGQMMDMGREGMARMGGPNAQEDAKNRGTVGIALALETDAVGAPGRLVVRGVEPQSPAHYAGIMRGDRIVAVDGQSVDGKKLDEAANMIRGEPGNAVKLGLDRAGAAREVTLTRVEAQRRPQRGMGRMGGMGERGGMGNMRGMGNMGSAGQMGGMMDMMRMHQGMMGSGPGGNAAEPQR